MSIKTRNGVPVEVEDEPKKFVAAVRCSTRRQSASGHSYENQLDGIKSYIHDEKGVLIKTFTLQQSGRSMLINQSALAEILRYVEETGSTLVINSLERLSRDVQTLWSIKKLAEDKKLDVVVAQTRMNLRDLDTMTYSALAAMAQFEQEQTRKRILDSKYKSKGYFNKENAIEAASKSQKVRKQNFDLWIETVDLHRKLKDAADNCKKPTLKAFSTWLKGQGSLSYTGQPWNEGTLRNTIIRLGYESLQDYVWRKVLDKKTVWTKEMGRIT